MKNFALIALLFLSLFAGSCMKNINTPLSFLVDTVANVYVDNNDSATLPLHVKFVAGNDAEQVKVTITGLPNNVRMSPDTVFGTGNFIANFKFYADSAVIGNYPVQLVTYSPTNGFRSYTFNLGVVHNNCAGYLVGTFSGTDACRSTNYTYTSTATSLGDSAILINNIGGYGVNTNAVVLLNCNTDSVTISKQNVGNGVTMWGQGRFSASQIVISYIALNVPGSYNDTCTMTLNR